MATKNIVPRANKEGQLGTDAKQWNKVIAHTGSFQVVSSSLIPDSTNTYDLGSTTKFWKDIYVSSGSIKFIDPSDNSVASTLSVDSNGTFTLGNITLNSVISSSVQIDHDTTTNFVANEHIDHSTVSISAGGILSGGGDITTNRTITLASSDVVHDSTTGFVANEHIDHTSVTLTAGSGLTGGGDISSNRTFNVGAGTGITVNANDVAIGQDVATTANVTFGSVVVSNDVTINGNLSVLGDATELQVSNLRIEDKLIEVASGSADSAAADGAGILIGGANESLKWHHGTTTFQFSDDLYVSGSITLSGTVDGRDIATDGTKLDTIETNADVTDTANVTSAGALMDSEVTDLDGIKSLTVPNNTTISTFGASLVDDADASAARTTLGVDASGTDNSTLSGLTATAIGKAIVTGSNAAAVRSTIGVDVAGTDNSTNVTLAGTPDYITISGQTITRNTIDIGDDTNLTAGTGITLTGDTLSTTDSEIVHDNLSGFVANEHIDHSSVSITAGNGLTGGGTIAASRTIDIGAGTGIDVAADAISVDVSDFMTNGANNRVLTATGTDAMNAESGLTYDGSNLDVTGGVRATGDVVAYYSSDKRLKDNIIRIENPLEKVSKIGGYTYDWNDKQNTYEVGSKDFGVIAQEIQEVLPELVTERDNGYLAVKYEKIVPLLIESIKELKQEIDDIKQKCDCLNK